MNATPINLIPSNAKVANWIHSLTISSCPPDSQAVPCLANNATNSNAKSPESNISRCYDDLSTQEMHTHLFRRIAIEVVTEVVLWPRVCSPSTMLIEEVG